MKKIHCSVIQDLLPAYAEDLASTETNKLVAAHLEECSECREVVAAIEPGSVRPDEVSAKTDKKIIFRMRFDFVWYLFWPSLYAASLQFGRQEQVFRFMVTILVLVFGMLIIYPMQDMNFDDEKRRDFYQKEEIKINDGKGSLLRRSLFWIIPVLVPVIIGLISWGISQ